MLSKHPSIVIVQALIVALVSLEALGEFCEIGQPCRHVIRPIGIQAPHTPGSGVFCQCRRGICPTTARNPDKSVSWFMEVIRGKTMIVETSFCGPKVPRKPCARGQAAVEAQGYSPFNITVSKIRCRCRIIKRRGRRMRQPLRQQVVAQNLQNGQFFYKFTCFMPQCSPLQPRKSLCARVYYNHAFGVLRTVSMCRCPFGFICPHDMRLPDQASPKDSKGYGFAPIHCMKAPGPRAT